MGKVARSLAELGAVCQGLDVIESIGTLSHGKKRVASLAGFATLAGFNPRSIRADQP